MKYGRLTIIGYSGNKSKDGHKLIIAKCDCGNIWEGRLQSLKDGSTKSCGCLEKELKSKRSYVLADATRKHGASIKTHPLFLLYGVWKAFNNRCNNKNDRNYCRYGNRGITVCKQWSNKNPNGFQNFAKWAEGKYFPGLTIERIRNDNHKGYYPSNCRFVTQRINNLNKRNNAKITFNGVTKNRMG